MELLDEIVATGWVYSITGLMEPGKRGRGASQVLVVLLVPCSPRGTESATVPNFRSALQWLEKTIIENHGWSPLARRLKKSGTA